MGAAFCHLVATAAGPQEIVCNRGTFRRPLLLIWTRKVLPLCFAVSAKQSGGSCVENILLMEEVDEN